MSDLKISEAGTVQFPMVKHATEIGWDTAHPRRSPSRSAAAKRAMLLRDELEAKLSDFNPWLSADALRSIIEKLDAIPATVDGNREMLMWLRGERGWYDEAEKTSSPHSADRFRISRRQRISRFMGMDAENRPARKGNRVDVMFLVNGVPRLHRRTQESEGWRRHRARHQAASPL